MQNNQNPNNEYEKHVAENSGDYRVKARKYENLIAKILCVLAAIVLWFYVVITDTTIDEKIFSGITVGIRNFDQVEAELGLSVITGYDLTVDVTVKGSKNDINRLNIDDIAAYVDAKDISGAGEYMLPIKFNLPGGYSISGQSANYITVYVDKRTTISVPIEVVATKTIENSYTMGEPELSMDSVTVSGPAEELAKVDHAVVTLDLGRVTKTMTASGKLVLVDKNNSEITNPYVKLQTSEVTVKFPVYIYKDVPLTVEYKYGYYNNSNVTITIEPASIRVKGDPDVLESMDSIMVQQIDEKKITSDTTLTTTIMLPDDVENVSGVKTASITITHKGTDTRTVVISNLTVINPNSLNYELQSNEINVVFRGKKDFLNMLNSNNVMARIDLGYLNNTAGTVSVPVNISVVTALAGSVYEIGEYKIDVTIKP